MLTLSIDLADTARPWRLDGRTYTAGSSRIIPVDHPVLETLAVDDGAGESAVIVRERRPDTPAADPAPRLVILAEYARLLDEVAAWPGDALIVFTHQAGWMRLSAHHHGVAPLYAAASDTTLNASWKMGDLAGLASGEDETEVVRLLSRRPRYSHHTFLSGIHRLTERATLHFGSRGIEMHYPPAAHHSEPRPMRPDADVLGAYDQLLERAVARAAYDPGTTAVQLSGGLDSAVVGLTLGRMHPGLVRPAAMLLPGEPGAQQTRRRAEMITHMGLGSDVTVTMLENPPLSPTGPRMSGAAATCYEDIYLEANQDLLAALAEQGMRTVFTGVGGDEMVALSATEYPHPPAGTGLAPLEWMGPRTRDLLDHTDEDIAPASRINEMTLLAHASAAPAILRAGMWPAHPFSDPDLITFGEWLPRHWRSAKRLHRARLQALGVSTDVVAPRLQEHFRPIIEHALPLHIAPAAQAMLERGSPLIEHGFIDPDGLAEVAKRVLEGDVRDRDTELFHPVAVDAAIRALT